MASSEPCASSGDVISILVQQVEVADQEVRIMESRRDLLSTLTAAMRVKSAPGGIRGSVMNWRKGCPVNAFEFAHI